MCKLLGGGARPPPVPPPLFLRPCVVLGGVVEVAGSNLVRGKIFTASIGSVDSLYPSVFIYCLNLHQFLILCSSKAMMFVKLYFCTSDIYLKVQGRSVHLTPFFSDPV